MSLYLKRLERGRFVWPSTSDGAVVMTSALDRRNHVRSWRPSVAG
jgi:transposase